MYRVVPGGCPRAHDKRQACAKSQNQLYKPFGTGYRRLKEGPGNMMNCSSAVKTLEELRLSLIEKGVPIPRHITEELVKGRSLARIYSLEPDDAELAAKAMAALDIVEMNLLSLIEKNVDAETADTWQRKIKEAYLEQDTQTAAEATATGVYPGIPKGGHFIRLKIDYLDTLEGASELLERFAVTARKQEDGFLLMHGKKEDISAFLEAVRDKVREAGPT